MDVQGNREQPRGKSLPNWSSVLLARLGNSSPPVAGIIFDLCGVLYDGSAWQRWLLRVLTHLGIRANYAAFARLWECECGDRLRHGTQDYWLVMRQFLRSTGLTAGQIDQVEAAGRAQWARLQEDVRPLPGVLPTLDALDRRGVPLAVLCSNWLSRDEIVRRLVRMRMGGRFRWVLSEAELLQTVPEPKLFPRVVGTVCLPANRLVYVGREPHSLNLAAAAGLWTATVDSPPTATTRICLERFSQLLEALPCQPARLMAG